MTTMRFEGTRKRRRTAITDYAWSNGDRADVWMQDCWCEGVVIETNKNDITPLAVKFPVLGETSVVRSWNVQPNIIWKDRKWIEGSSLNGGRASEGETPKEKRIKFDSHAVKDIRKDKFPENIDVVKSRRSEHHFNKGKLAPAADGKTPKVEVKDKSIPEVNETRRSNRKIQPTSRLLEGLQSSLTISKSFLFHMQVKETTIRLRRKGRSIMSVRIFLNRSLTCL